MKSLPKSWFVVTPLSKKLALVMMVVLPILAFWYGMQYQMLLIDRNGITCTLQVKK